MKAKLLTAITSGCLLLSSWGVHAMSIEPEREIQSCSSYRAKLWSFRDTGTIAANLEGLCEFSSIEEAHRILDRSWSYSRCPNNCKLLLKVRKKNNI